MLKNRRYPKMETRKVNKVNEVTLAKAMGQMFKDMKSGNTIYLAFSKKSFYILVFVMAMSVIANVALVNLLINAPTLVQKTDTVTFIVQLTLSASAIVAGFWLFLKGVNIVTDK